MTSLPQSVKVGGINYRITNDPDDWMRKEHSSREFGLYGCTNHKGSTIFLDPDATEEVTRLTLWHEVLHAVLEVLAGSPTWTHLGKTPSKREETIIRRLESPTFMVMRDNPELLAYLTA